MRSEYTSSPGSQHTPELADHVDRSSLPNAEVPITSTSPSPPAGPGVGRPAWPWLVFGLAAVWAAIVRIPLIINAHVHLDSDLAVDGLTLLDATRGQWRWHYPGTPFIGIGPVLCSLPQAMIWGATPSTLVSGGTVVFLALMLVTLVLAWKAYGPSVAAWSLLPLACASTGVVWLSGRITGGHLVAAVWHAGAFAVLVSCLERRRVWTWGMLGLWCGLGFYLDPMFGLSLAGLGPAALVGVLGTRVRAGAFLSFAAFAGAFVIGAAPRVIGERSDAHNAYLTQFETVTQPALIQSHALTLVAECLPRLIAGHQIPWLETDPEPTALLTPSPARRASQVTPLAIAVTAVSGLALAFAIAHILASCWSAPTRAGRAVAIGLVIASAGAFAGFIANRNIFNSDNYRYLVDLLVPWSLGFGMALDRLARGKGWRPIAAWVFAVTFAVLMTLDLGRWYARFGWVDGHYLPVKASLDDRALAWLEAHPDVLWITGGYWDVYRLSFLTGGRVRGAPFPIYPNRYPRAAPKRGDKRAQITRASPEGRAFRDAGIRAGMTVVEQAKGVAILVFP